MASNFTAFIVEDEKANVKVLKKLISDYCPGLTVIGEASDIVESVKALSIINPDIVFLDVELSDGLSFEILKNLPERKFEVIFITAHNEYAVRAFRYAAVDFLQKPVNPLELAEAVARATFRKNRIKPDEQMKLLYKSFIEPSGKSETMALPTIDGLHFISISDIIRLEAEGGYTNFYLVNNEKIMVSKTLKDFEDLLDDHNFMRIHHSHIINLKKLKRYVKGNGGHVIMVDNSQVDVAARRKDEFLNRVKQ